MCFFSHASSTGSHCCSRADENGPPRGSDFPCSGPHSVHLGDAHDSGSLTCAYTLFDSLTQISVDVLPVFEDTQQNFFTDARKSVADDVAHQALTSSVVENLTNQRSGLREVAVFGVLLIIAGIGQTVSAFWSPRWRGLLVHMLTGILYLVVGYIVVDNPMESAVALTLLIASFLLVMGVFRIVVSLLERFHNWGWCLLSGCVSGLLGILILKQWPASGEWVIGLFLGIEMLFNGVAWIMMADTLRRMKKPA